MHLNLSILLVLASVTLCYSALSLERPNPKAEKGQCLPTSYDIGSIKYGESKPIPNICMEARCGDDGTVQYASCGVFGAPPPGCKYEEPPKDAIYPECCDKKLVCA